MMSAGDPDRLTPSAYTGGLQAATVGSVNGDPAAWVPATGGNSNTPPQPQLLHYDKTKVKLLVLANEHLKVQRKVVAAVGSLGELLCHVLAESELGHLADRIELQLIGDDGSTEPVRSLDDLAGRNAKVRIVNKVSDLQAEMEPEPELAGPGGWLPPPDTLYLDGPHGTGTDSKGTVYPIRESWMNKSGDFAVEYRDDETKSGCTQCPPTCAATKTFIFYMLRALVPFLFLLELLQRWCQRKLTDSKRAPRERLVTVRKMADCVGWLYFSTLIYMVLCNSSHFHAWVKGWSSGLGIRESWGWKLLLGSDPWEVNLPDDDGNTTSDTFIDVALSETYYPVFAYLLLVVLYAHEETSYPRRMRIEHSVETDRLLLRAVDAIKQMAYSPGLAEAERKAQKHRNIMLTTITGAILVVVGLETMSLYILESAWNGIDFSWIGTHSQLLLPIGSLLFTMGLLLVVAMSKRGWMDRFGAQYWDTCCCKPSRQSGRNASRLRDSLLPQSGAAVDLKEDGSDPRGRAFVEAATLKLRVTGVYVGTLLSILGFEALALSGMASQRSTTNTWNTWLLDNGAVSPVVGLLCFCLGALLSEKSFSDAKREGILRKKTWNEIEVGTRVEMIETVVQSGVAGDIGRITRIPGQQYEGKRLRPNECVVELDKARRDTLKQYQKSGKFGQAEVIMKLENLKGVDCATKFYDNYVSVTVNELKKFSFDAEKYSERYSRRYRELQCTPIENYHFRKFDNQCLNQSAKQNVIDICVAWMDDCANHQPYESNIATAEIGQTSGDGDTWCWQEDAQNWKPYSSENQDEIERNYREAQAAGEKQASCRVGNYDIVLDLETERHRQQHRDHPDRQRKVSKQTKEVLASQDSNISHKHRVSRWASMLPSADQRRAQLEKLDESELIDIARDINEAELNQILRKDRHNGDATDTADKKGPFFKYFQDSLIFGQQKQWSNAIWGAWWGAGCGLMAGALLAGSPLSIGAGASIGLFAGALIGYRMITSDPAAHHLATHILELHQKIAQECKNSPETREETHPHNDCRDAQKYESFDHNPASVHLTADRVAKMIIFLSKARQFKRRQHWHTRLWVISLLHAAIPLIYSFAATVPAVALMALGLLVAAAAVATVRPSEENKAYKDLSNMCLDECCDFKKQCHKYFKKCVLGLFCVFFLVAFGWGLFGRGQPPLFQEDSVKTDICGAILDTQGHCCCENSQVLANHFKSSKCCPSEFVDQRGHVANGQHIIGSSGVCSVDQLCEDSSLFIQPMVIFEPYNPQTQICFGQDWLDEGTWREDDAHFLDYDGSAARPTIQGWCSRLTAKGDAFVNKTDTPSQCHYRVAKKDSQACMLPFYTPFGGDSAKMGCLACGGTFWAHLLNFWANATVTFAIVSRLYRCYEDYFVQYLLPQPPTLTAV